VVLRAVIRSKASVTAKLPHTYLFERLILCLSLFCTNDMIFSGILFGNGSMEVRDDMV